MNQPRLRHLKFELLSQNWATLKRVTYDWLSTNNAWEKQVRESYDRGNGATVLLYDQKKRKIILTEQFRIPTYLNGNASGMMLEAPAGKLDEKEDPETSILREIEEETGYRVPSVQKIFELYMSPGSVTEIITFYQAPVDEEMRVGVGGGKEDEQEEIKVIEMSFDDVVPWISSGKIKDAKTIILLQHALLKSLWS